MRIAILQSNYLPWKGYFDIVGSVDTFVFHDDVQYTKGDWRNRNQIKTASGLSWLSVPCGSNQRRLICEVEISNSDWQRKHWNLIKLNYQKSPFFSDYRLFFEEIYLNQIWTNLSCMNQYIIKAISNDLLGLSSRFVDSRSLNLKLRRGERVIELLKKMGAKQYLSGPAAKTYLDESDFLKEGIELRYMDYKGYPEYPQLYPPFVHEVSILDLLFNTGAAATNYMLFRSLREKMISTTLY